MNILSQINESILGVARTTVISVIVLFIVLISSSIIIQEQQRQPVVAYLERQHVKLLLLSNTQSLPSSFSSNIADIFKKVENSVVQVTSTIESGNPNLSIIINGNPVTQNETALGSGFVYDTQGHIITNNHVVANATNINVSFVDGNTYSAKVVGKDVYSDIAVLQLTDNFSSERLVPLVIGNSSQSQVGQQVLAIGNPFGLSASMTTGIVGQMGRLLPSPVGQYSIANGIQTDAAINPGNSGGPLLNLQGQVIGINTAIISSSGAYSGIGFAIPSDTINKELPSIIEKGTFMHPWIGFAGGKIAPSLARVASLPQNYKGVMVASVEADSPAAKAGLKGLNNATARGVTNLGDIVTAVDGHPIRQMDDIINYIESAKSVGDNIKLTLNRGGKVIDLMAILQPRPSPEVLATSSSSLPSTPRLPPFEIP